MNCEQQSLTARYVFPVAGPPLSDGIVTISGDKITAVEPAGSRTADVDLGYTAILPGLVNAHTHLDLSGLRGQCPPTSDFTGWLRQVIAHRRRQNPQQVEADIQTGIAECLRTGTTLVGDISSGGLSWSLLAQSKLRAVVFWEMLGLPLDRARQAWQQWLQWQDQHHDSPTCRRGLSPHAPYSVHHELIRDATATNLPLAIHLAETQAELELLADQSGLFQPFLSESGVWDPTGLTPSVDEILRTTAQARQVLYIHANYLPSETSIPPHATVVYCPRTHAAFGHPPHPFREFLARGVRVALGTDSLASNPDLDLLAEMRFIHRRFPDFPGNALLRMGTLSGAEALGWADETGSLEPGKSADLIVVPLPNEDAPPHRLLFESDLPVSRTMIAGQWLDP
jgi:cytosine/adenosine deaminase-related metal-dependent hydrolase